jgi:hypothetical protein
MTSASEPSGKGIGFGKKQNLTPKGSGGRYQFPIINAENVQNAN